jgi:hypothetical protein
MNCSGSVHLSAALAGDASLIEEPDYQAQGTAAHELAAECLEDGSEVWEKADEIYNGLVANTLDLTAVQTYLDHCRTFMVPGTATYIETMIGREAGRRPHPDFYGTVDFGAVSEWAIDIVDYKNGAGVFVEVEDNPQFMYYAFGFLQELQRESFPEGIEKDFPVNIHVVQPRIEWMEPIRTWSTTAGYILKWAYETLIPRMSEVHKENEFSAGEWCRFCPAKLACPLLKGMMHAAATTNPAWIKDAPADVLGQEYLQISIVKMYLKAVEDEAYSRLMAGRTVTGLKLVDKRANRIWKEDAIENLKLSFGSAIYNPPTLKSPPEMEKLGPDAKKLVSEFAYSPHTGYTVDLASSRKPAVNVKTPAETFASFTQAGMEKANG